MLPLRQITVLLCFKIIDHHTKPHGTTAARIH